jgi:hypothetical protein
MRAAMGETSAVLRSKTLLKVISIYDSDLTDNG